MAVETLERHLSYSDSTQLVSLGIPFKPSSIAIVSDSLTCEAVLASYNAPFAPSDTLRRVASGYVVQAGNAYGLFFPSSPTGLEVVYYFDSTFTYKFNLAGLQ